MTFPCQTPHHTGSIAYVFHGVNRTAMEEAVVLEGYHEVKVEPKEDPTPIDLHEDAEIGKPFFADVSKEYYEIKEEPVEKKEFNLEDLHHSIIVKEDTPSELITEVESPSCRQFECEVCNVKFPLKSEVLNHTRAHTGAAICELHITTRDDLKVPFGEKLFSCEICVLKFSTKQTLKYHIMRFHTEDKPFACGTCSYKCSNNPDLKRHMVTHVSKKPYACAMCDYKSIRKEHLRSHLKVHTGEKPFGCDICDYKTTTKRNLNYHMVTHTGEKPFGCARCDFKTASKSHLKEHLKTHTGEKPFACEICAYKCSFKGNLKRHMVTHSR